MEAGAPGRLLLLHCLEVPQYGGGIFHQGSLATNEGHGAFHLPAPTVFTQKPPSPHGPPLSLSLAIT